MGSTKVTSYEKAAVHNICGLKGMDGWAIADMVS
jgi:hypothetical protein